MRRGLFWIEVLGNRLCDGMRCLETRREERGVRGSLVIVKVPWFDLRRGFPVAFGYISLLT